MSWGLHAQIKELREALEAIHKVADQHWGGQAIMQRIKIRSLARKALDGPESLGSHMLERD